MPPARVPHKPRRRTYQTGGRLPELTTDWRPIPLGRDEQGDVDAQIRALAVLLRNRSERSVYIREGPDSDDAFEISRGEDYKIWEPNGVSTLSMRGSEGGETVEVRTLEAHNDFDITDRVEAFARSIAHFIGTATSNTNISGQDVELTIDDAGGISVVGDMDANITGSEVDIPITGEVDANIVNSVLDVDIDGPVDAEIINSVLDISGGVDIEAQSVGDISVADIEGRQHVAAARTDGESGDNETWTFIEDSEYDGFVTSYEVRFFEDQTSGSLDDMACILRIDGQLAVPRGVHSAHSIYDHSRHGVEASIGRYDPAQEVRWRYEPRQPIKFKAGDDVSFRVRSDLQYTSSTFIDYNVEVNVTWIERVTD